jgi:hypothetical protein
MLSDSVAHMERSVDRRNLNSMMFHDSRSARGLNGGAMGAGSRGCVKGGQIECTRSRSRENPQEIQAIYLCTASTTMAAIWATARGHGERPPSFHVLPYPPYANHIRGLDEVRTNPNVTASLFHPSPFRRRKAILQKRAGTRSRT